MSPGWQHRWFLILFPFTRRSATAIRGQGATERLQEHGSELEAPPARNKSEGIRRVRGASYRLSTAPPPSWYSTMARGLLESRFLQQEEGTRGGIQEVTSQEPVLWFLPYRDCGQICRLNQWESDWKLTLSHKQHCMGKMLLFVEMLNSELTEFHTQGP